MKTSLALLCIALPLWAHHSTRAAFDSHVVVKMEGVVGYVRWLNPHATLFVDVADASGRVSNWEIELPSPIGLMREGWKRHDLEPGAHVTLDVWLAKKGAQLATMRSLTMPDGRVISGQTVWDGPLPELK